MQPTAAAVMGTVEAWPIRPVAIAGEPNTRPVSGAVVEALHDGKVLAATTTDDAGRYELRVPPGTYLIRATAEGLYSKEPGKTVTVSPGETLTIRFVLDTGIRCPWGHHPATCPLGTMGRWATLLRGSDPSRPPSGADEPARRGVSRTARGTATPPPASGSIGLRPSADLRQRPRPTSAAEMPGTTLVAPAVNN